MLVRMVLYEVLALESVRRCLSSWFRMLITSDTLLEGVRSVYGLVNVLDHHEIIVHSLEDNHHEDVFELVDTVLNPVLQQLCPKTCHHSCPKTCYTSRLKSCDCSCPKTCFWWNSVHLTCGKRTTRYWNLFLGICRSQNTAGLPLNCPKQSRGAFQSCSEMFLPKPPVPNLFQAVSGSERFSVRSFCIGLFLIRGDQSRKAHCS